MGLAETHALGALFMFPCKDKRFEQSSSDMTILCEPHAACGFLSHGNGSIQRIPVYET